jgi:hypothetical protein
MICYFAFGNDNVALLCNTMRNDGDVTSRNLTPMHKMLIGVAFKNMM